MKTLCAVTSVVFTLSAQAALAQAKAVPDGAQFIDMGEVVINGEIRKPLTMVILGHERIKWDRLFHLKKSMRPALHTTAGETTFR